MKYLIVIIIFFMLVPGCSHRERIIPSPSEDVTGASFISGDIEKHRRHGMEFRMKKQAARACEEFYKLLEVDPSNPGARAELIRLLVSRDHLGEALEVFRESEKYRATPELLLAGTELYLALADYDEADRLLGKFEKIYKGDKRHDVVLMRARILAGKQKFESAEKLLKKAIEEFQSPLAKIDLATFLCNRGRSEEGMRIFEELERSLPPDPQDRASFYREKLRAAFLAKRPDMVNDTIPLYLETSVDRAEALQNLGILYYRLGFDPAKGEEYLLKAIKMDRGLERAVEVLAEIYEHQGREDELLKVASILGPRNTKLRMMQAGIKRRDGDFEKAEEIYRDILESHPDIKKWTMGEVETCVLYNQILADQGRFGEAEKLIDMVEKFQADSGPLCVMKARLLRKKGEYGKAEELLYSAFRFDPERPDLRVVVALAELYMEAGWDEKAEKALGEALEIFPGLQTACVMMAKLELKKGNRDRAQAWIDRLTPANKERFERDIKK
ncbi:MAG: tetratricopeptide repeat protein [Candidatus Eremiobacteraeota bacterium]|nr:tetratricopeptide repeat protein [Candidatus Eremiobacteraeota bacterium]